MGFNKLHLPDLEYLKESLKEKGNEEFVNFWTMRYARADALIGPPESMDFIKQIIDREYNYRTTGQISIDFDQVED